MEEGSYDVCNIDTFKTPTLMHEVRAVINLKLMLSEDFLLPLVTGICLLLILNSEWAGNQESDIKMSHQLSMLAFFLLMSLFEYLIAFHKIVRIGDVSSAIVRVISAVYSLQMLLFLPSLVFWFGIIGQVLIITPVEITDGNEASDIISQVVVYIIIFFMICAAWRFFFFHYMAVARLLSRWILRKDSPRVLLRLIDYVYYLMAALGISVYLVETHAGMNAGADTTATLIVASFIVLGLRFTKVTLEFRSEEFIENLAGIRSFTGTPIWPAAALDNWICSMNDSETH